ncbi:MAG: PEGA domain-containing protein [Myxococcales bacterium]|nr:PEGA domain-containing protein [Myxococcales bacterium]
MPIERVRSATRALSVLAAFALAATPASAQSTNGAEPDAATLFAQAREHMRDGRWALARNELATACERQCTPAVAYNLALAERALGHIRAALSALDRYEAFVREQRSADGIARATALRAELDASLARLEFVCHPTDATIAVDAVALASGSHALAVDPGEHTIRAEAAGHEPSSQSIAVSAGETRRVELALRAVAIARPPASIPPAATTVRVQPRRGSAVPWIVGGVAGGVAITVATLVAVFVIPAPPYEGSLGLVRFGPSGAQ